MNREQLDEIREWVTLFYEVSIGILRKEEEKLRKANLLRGPLKFWQDPPPCGECYQCVRGFVALCEENKPKLTPDEWAWYLAIDPCCGDTARRDYWSGAALDKIPDRSPEEWFPPLTEEDWRWIDNLPFSDIQGLP